MRSPNNPKLAAALLAALVCASCVTTTPSGPPWALLEDCTAPPWAGTTNGDLVRHNRALRNALGACNDDKAALREWAKDR
jgi:hypothetical protein